MLFVGDDWAEAHHDIEIQDEAGRRLARRRLPEGLAGIGALHALLAEHLPADAEPSQVVVGIETDRGAWVQALSAAGYQVYAVNPRLDRFFDEAASKRPHLRTFLSRTLAAARGPERSHSELMGHVRGLRPEWGRLRTSEPPAGEH